MREVIVNITLRVGNCRANVLCERKRANSVHNAEIHCFRFSAQVFGGLSRRFTENAFGGFRVNVAPLLERFNHYLVFGERCENAQFNLTVIGVAKHFSLTRDKEFSEVPSEFRPHGNVLNIRFGGAYAPCSCFGLFECGVHSSVLGNRVLQSLNVCVVQFRQLSMFENWLYNRAFVQKRFKRFGVRRIACFALFRGRKSHLLEQYG